MKPIIPEWVSCKTYAFGTEDSRTFISNEKAHDFLLLEGVSSDIWHIIEISADMDAITLYASDHGIGNELESFIDELVSDGLLEYYKNEHIAPNYEQMNLGSIEDDIESAKMEEEMRAWCLRKGYMWSVLMELTYKCNLSCIHCYNPNERGYVAISFDDAKRIIDDMVELGCSKLVISGGEPTINKDFLNIVRYARSKRISVEIFTNGQTLYNSPSLLEELLTLYPYRIGVSIYSGDSDIHDSVTCVNGSYNKSYNFLNSIRERGVNIQVKCIVLKETVDYYKSIKPITDSLKCSSSLDLGITPKIDGDTATYNHMVTDAHKLLMLYCDPESPLYLGDKINYGAKDIDLSRNGTPCSAGEYGLTITPKLDVVFCVSFHLVLGNVKSDSLIQIWKDGFTDQSSKLYQWRQLTLSDFHECFKDDYCQYCDYCPGIAMMEGNMYGKSIKLCERAKIKMKAANYLKAGMTINDIH